MKSRQYNRNIYVECKLEVETLQSEFANNAMHVLRGDLGVLSSFQIVSNTRQFSVHVGLRLAKSLLQ